jgi:hypothetical protein
VLLTAYSCLSGIYSDGKAALFNDYH